MSTIPGKDATLERPDGLPRSAGPWHRRALAMLVRALPVANFSQAFASTLARRDLLQIVAYVVLSLGAALAGSIAAICLVPLVQPGPSQAFSRYDSVEMQALAFGVATGSFALLRWQAARLGAALASRCGMNLRRMVHARLIDAPLGELADTSSAEIANLLTYNIEILVQGFGALLQLAIIGVTTAVSLAFVFWVSPTLMLVSPALLGMGLLAARAWGREQSTVSRQYVADMTRLFWLSEDFPRRLRYVRSFEREGAEKAGYGAIAAQLGLGYRRQLELVAAGRLVLELAAAAGIAGAFVLAHRWHGIDSASLIAVSLLLGRLLPYLVSTRQSCQQLRSAAPALELWKRHMRHRRDALSAVSARALAMGDVLAIGRLRLRAPLGGLCVRDLVLAPGELTLVSGDSGIGKSSLVDVLAGMTLPADFTAGVGGQSIGFDDYRALVRNGAYVSQSVRPWQHTVRECLAWAAPAAGEETMLGVLEDVGLGRWLGATREGLDAALYGSASRLSGGELQRLMLAQVILRQPLLAVLDEATGALDASSELAVLAALKRRLPRSILIVVSHRASVATMAEQHLEIGRDLASTVVRYATTGRSAPGDATFG
ncbi:ATP-binding cassette, subfamily C [Frateuria terrea]|uniref:ATP-binding cassette, subfamily C n=2 Tax=Frateuria terrea TaxID=529704 RepID=A0A1H6WVK7_9GAMM|nr:ABC transporter ATP-binding protein [Frateuria terrea]SEJ18337.1 ATP-binding cassette, subfamily C [Frateuria terrea]SFP56906.1 ATP-binding cassette, subfamily C [Frateuria terrea]